MPATIQIKRTAVPGNAPAVASLAEGELAVELASPAPRLWVGVPAAVDGTGRRLIADLTLIETLAAQVAALEARIATLEAAPAWGQPGLFWGRPFVPGAP